MNATSAATNIRNVLVLIVIIIFVLYSDVNAKNASSASDEEIRDEPWIPIVTSLDGDESTLVDAPNSISNEINETEKPWTPIITDADLKSSQEEWNPIITNEVNETEEQILQEDWTPVFSKNFKNNNYLRNFTIYLGYANNPFGPSKKLHHKKPKLNVTEKLQHHSKKNTSLNDPTSELGANEIDSDLEETNVQEARPKRGVIHLYNMVSCATGCNPLIYKGYGCYCGFLGSGFAVDGIDSCCRRHDWCYVRSNCPMFLEYFIPYFWRCYRNRPLCALDHGEWGGYGSCSYRLCECDRILSECLSRYPCPSSRALCTSSPWRLLQNTLMIF